MSSTRCPLPTAQSCTVAADTPTYLADIVLLLPLATSSSRGRLAIAVAARLSPLRAGPDLALPPQLALLLHLAKPVTGLAARSAHVFQAAGRGTIACVGGLLECLLECLLA